MDVSAVYPLVCSSVCSALRRGCSAQGAQVLAEEGMPLGVHHDYQGIKAEFKLHASAEQLTPCFWIYMTMDS